MRKKGSKIALIKPTRIELILMIKPNMFDI